MTETLAHDQSELAQALFEECGDALFLIDPDNDRLVEVNPVALRLTGYSRAELLQHPAASLFRFEAAGGLQRLRGAFSKTMVFHGQDGFLLRTKDDAWVPVNLTVSRLHIAPKTLGLVIARDDRDRRQALSQTRRVEAELRAVLASSPAALWSAERAPGADVMLGWQFRYVSPLLARIAGRSHDYFDHPFKWADAVHPGDEETYREWHRRLLAGAASEGELLYRVVVPGGTLRWVRERLQVVRDASGRPARLDGCLVDVTEQRQAEDALRQNEQRFRALVEKNRDGIMLIDQTGRIDYSSPAVRESLGFEPADVVGRELFEFVHPDSVEAARAQLAECLRRPGEAVAQTLHVRAADGSVRVIESSVCNRFADPSVGAVVVNYRDVTGPARLEERLRQSQKMEAVGQLAGGIAHDFNNLLTIILGNLELVRGNTLPGEVPELLAASERAARHAADLTRQMLGFARREPLRTTTLDLNALARESIVLLRRTFDPRITVRFDLANDLRPTVADPVQIQQVLMNLCLNARDAMPEGGTLSVETANAGDVKHPERDANERGEEFVRLSVGDTGVGMTDEVRGKIFEPFFTTKEIGRGTGLGLAVVYGIARAHGGWVECSTTPGSGSRFDVFLPRGVVSSELFADRDLANTPPPAQGELVLVADDEPLVRAIARRSLERSGYRVLEAADGAEAVEVFRREAASIAVVVLDMSMPRMSGLEACDAIRSVDPQARVLFASGHSVDVSANNETTAFLHKPYTPTTLAAAVAKML